MFGYVPTAWKSAKFISIPKPGKPPSDPCSHRPSSILSTISKLPEHIKIGIKIVQFQSKL
jgi:hypothetical protein